MVSGEEVPLGLAHLGAPGFNRGSGRSLVCSTSFLGCVGDGCERSGRNGLARRTDRDTQVPHFTVLDVIDPSVDEDISSRSTFTGATFNCASAVCGEQGVVLRSEDKRLRKGKGKRHGTHVDNDAILGNASNTNFYVFLDEGTESG